MIWVNYFNTEAYGNRMFHKEGNSENKKSQNVFGYTRPMGPWATLLTDGALAEAETEREIYLHINV